MTTTEPAARHVANDADTGTFGDALLRALHWVRPNAVRIATAYVTPDGFMALRDGLDEHASVQVLLGERPFLMRRGPDEEMVRPSDADDLHGPEEAIDWYGFLEGDYPWVLMTQAERAAALDDPAADEKVIAPFNLAAWEKVRAFVRFLRRDGVEVRRYLGEKAAAAEPNNVLGRKVAPKARLHAKTYLLLGEDAAFSSVGSSNLTKGGLNDNIELNLVSEDRELASRLNAWFAEKWRQGVDCRDEFIRLLEDSVLFGPHHTPWHIFIKALHAAYGKYLDLTLGDDIAGRLASFQQEAVTRCVGLLDRHWGAMLCDSVGLGKTYEGLGILAEFARRRQESSNETVRALVICPAQLQENWSSDKLAAYGIVGETITMESLPALIVDEGEEEPPAERQRRERKLRHLQNFDIVLVDESHNFRNPQTKRYRALLEVLRGGDRASAIEKRVVLLTATPINNTPWDLYWQLNLITRGEDTWYSGRGPISNLRQTFRRIDKGEASSGLLDAMLLSLVRRTRHDIRALQDAGQPMELNGQPMRFPHHEIPKAINYSIEALYSGIYREITATIEGLKFAVYDLESFGVRTEAGEDAPEGTLKQRNKTFIGIMKTIFLKRMESSIVALMATVESMVRYLDLFLDEMERRNRVLTPKDAQRLKVVLGGSLPDDALELGEWDERAKRAVAQLPAAPSDPGDRDRLRAAVRDDRERLVSLLEKLKATQAGWDGSYDPKVQALRKLLESLPATDELGVPTKAVVFTNYRDTAEYIFRCLGGPSPFTDLRTKSNLPGERWLSKLTGADSQQRRREILSHFAPLAAMRDTEPPDDPVLLEKIEPLRANGIDLLVATDVLSEGQNLQDAQYLINYDLPWNPVRMIQRAGRIDRLFSPHKNVVIYNIMPDVQLESLLKLVARLSKRVASIEDMVGLDASVLGEQIEEKTFDQMMKLAAGGERAEEVYREGERAQGLEDAFAELNKYVQLIKEIGTEEVQKLRDGIYSVREGNRSGVFIMLRMPEDVGGQVYWRFYPLDERDAVTTAREVLDIIAAARDTERLDLPEDENPFRYLQNPLQAAIDQLGQEYKLQVAEKTQDRFTTKLAQLLLREDLLEAEPELTEKLLQWREQAPPMDALNRPKVRDAVRAVRTLAAGARLETVVEVLRALWEGLQAEGLDRPFPKPPSREPTVRDLQLVCWELVLSPKDYRALTERPPNDDQLEAKTE